MVFLENSMNCGAHHQGGHSGGRGMLLAFAFYDRLETSVLQPIWRRAAAARGVIQAGEGFSFY